MSWPCFDDKEASKECEELPGMCCEDILNTLPCSITWTLAGFDLPAGLQVAGKWFQSRSNLVLHKCNGGHI